MRRAAAAGIALSAALFAASARAEDTAPAYAEGAKGFQANCAVCHGPAGAGIPGLAPPLSSYPAHYAASVEGRRQLAMTVLYGLFGDITVADHHYDFRMPEFSHLDDATLAAVLNFVVFEVGHAPASLKPLTAADILAERAKPVDGAAVREHRKSVVPSGG